MQSFEHFIPLTRRSVVALCAEKQQDPHLPHFAEILQAYIHHHYHQQLESLKQLFEPWDPDRDTVELETSSRDLSADEAALV